MKSIAVFCGAAIGSEKIYHEKARSLGKLLAESGIRVVFGGGKIGLMGVLADSVLDYGGQIVGVIPRFLMKKEVAHEGLQQIVVDSMHERKVKMFEMSDGVIAMPGGYGTLDELFEALTLMQLGVHLMPVGLLNVQGFFNGLIHLLDNMVEKDFLKQANRNLLLESEDEFDLLDLMKNARPAVVIRWSEYEPRF